MAATHSTATHLPAGPITFSVPLQVDEGQEYQKILAIKDQIFSGTHPRLSVPQHLVRKSGLGDGKNGLTRAPPPPATSSKPVRKNAPVYESANPTSQSSDSTFAANASSTPSIRVASKPTSTIDPIFLTKSDDLVKAERQLQRQRLERALRDQVELQKKESKQRPAVQDTKPPFDVSDVFKRALEIVKPASFNDPSDYSGPGEDSFDDNSFYSSRAPDDSSPPPVQQQIPSHMVPPTPRGLAARAPVTDVDELQRLEALNQPGSDLEMTDAYLVADQRPSYPQKQARHEMADTHTTRLHGSDQSDIEDEADYSPPAPRAPPADNCNFPPETEGPAGRQARADARYTDKPRIIREAPSPTNVKVVQNHITSPVAPRPSRVSPLAVAKAPPVQQTHGQRSGNHYIQMFSDPDSARGSPSGPVPNVISRKRRRLRLGDDGARKMNVETTETVIKEEPISPPPFTDDPHVVRSRHAREHPIYIDIASPQYAAVHESRGPPMREAVYGIDPHHEHPSNAGQHRTNSRLSTIRSMREDADPRRVTSLQYARPPDYPREYIRAASHFVERPVQDHPRYYEEAPSYPQYRYVPVDGVPSPGYREHYYEQAPLPMAPPPRRRIVVDEHGTQYYELQQAPRRFQPMAPPLRPVSQMPQDVYEEPQPQYHSASSRAPSVVQEPYNERRYGQEMPPPRPIYRRVTSDYSRPVLTHERPSYAVPLDGYEPSARGDSVQVAEYLPPRHTVYVDEQGVPQERIIRTTSVRPPQPRYEDAHSVAQRVGSVRPFGPAREPSSFMEERPMGEYVERPYYIRERRYYDGEVEEGDHITYDGAYDSAPRAPQRYQ